METLDREGYTAILWEGREYVPWGMVSDGRGKQVGYVDEDEKTKVYAYNGQSPEQWIVKAYGHDSAMLYREKSVTEIPAALRADVVPDQRVVADGNVITSYCPAQKQRRTWPLPCWRCSLERKSQRQSGRTWDTDPQDQGSFLKIFKKLFSKKVS